MKIMNYMLGLMCAVHVMSSMGAEVDLERSWIVVGSRLPQPLPTFPDETVKNLYQGIEDFDKDGCKQIVTENLGIVKVTRDYAVARREFKKATPLHIAAWIKNVPAIEVLLDAGADCNKKMFDELVPLHVAGNKRIAKLLVEKGRAVVDQENVHGYTPLHSALFDPLGQRLDVAHYLIKHGADLNKKMGEYERTVLCEAVCRRNENTIATVTFLLDRGAKTRVYDRCWQTPTSFIEEDNFRLRKIFNPVTQDKKAVFDLFVSLFRHDNIDCETLITALLDYEPDLRGIDAQGNTLMHKAIFYGNPKAVTFLVQYNVLPVIGNNFRQTVLDVAHVFEKKSCIDALNKAVFDKFFCTPCYKRGYKEIKSFLKYYFASEYKDVFVRGIVHYAALQRPDHAYEYCRRLLKWGAPVNIRSCAGDFPQHNDAYPLPLSWAVNRWDVDLIKLFLRHGAIVLKDMLDQSKIEDATYNMLQEAYKK